MTYDPDTRQADLPSPVQTWEESKLYVLEPFAYRGELDQGILRVHAGCRWRWSPRATRSRC